MKKLFTILAVALCSTLALAQTNQYFWAGGQFIMGNPINQIDSITFGQLEQTDSVLLYLPRTIRVVHDTIIQKEIVRMCDNAPEGVELVDLGLPSGIKWANMNIGATKPEEFGDYFAWGETATKTCFNWSTYIYCDGTYNTLTKYCTNNTYGTVDNKTTLDKDDDAASINWGGLWRMPTHAEQVELVNNCVVTWTNNYNETGVAGRIFTSKRTGYTDKSLFFPAAGYYDNSNLNLVGTHGYTWSSSPRENYPDSTWGLNFNSYIVNPNDYSSRFYGHTIRAVCK